MLTGIVAQPFSQTFRSRFFPAILALTASLIAGCGGGSSALSSGGSTLTGNTTVTLLATSTANDQLSQFSMQLTKLTLTSQSGKTVTVLNQSMTPEFIHLNGGVEPLASASIPQDVYSSATLTLGGAEFTCIALQPSGGLQTSQFAYGTVPVSAITVNLPQPITVTGSGMGLTLNLQVSQSASFSNCLGGGATTYTITPTFNLTPMTLAAQPTGTANGLAPGLEGIVSGIDPAAGTFQVAAAEGAPSSGLTWTVKAGSGTSYQGVGSFAALQTGMPVDMDVAVQTDGSLAATRLAVYDTNGENLTVSSGPTAFVDSGSPILNADDMLGQGYMHLGATQTYSYGNAAFQTAGQLSNLANLPFNASFSGADIVPGQNIYMTTHATTAQSYPTYIPASTVVLMPQTINGTVVDVATQGQFQVYTVSLAPYDLFSALAVQQGQSTGVSNPGVIYVYADNNAERVSTGSATQGSVLRFHGAVFNDNGTLRMDCLRINSGVVE